MAADATDDGDTGEGTTARDLRFGLVTRAADRPWLALGAAVLAALILAYATLIQQELFVAVWLLFVAFFAHLALRFVRATERIASAAERLAGEE